MRCLPVLFSSLFLLLPWPDSARAQSIQRCTAADGSSVFTDKPCALLQARPRMQAPAASPGADTTPIDPQRQCPRRLSQLVEQIQQAIQSGDGNRLAALYWWGGQGSAGAAQQLARLEAMAQRPLLDIAPVYPATLATAAVPDPPAGVSTASPASAEPAAPAPVSPAPAARPRPYALRIEQTLANGSTPASSVIQLRRHYGCFWFSF